MLTLRTRGLEMVRGGDTVPRIIRLSSNPNRPVPLRKNEGYISRDGSMPAGFAWYLVVGTETSKGVHAVPDGASAIFLPPAFAYLGDRDVVRIGKEKGDFAVLFQRSARHH